MRMGNRHGPPAASSPLEVGHKPVVPLTGSLCIQD